MTLHPLFAPVDNAITERFEISADRKVVSKKAGTGNGWQGFLSENPFPPEGRFKITIVLNYIGTKNMTVGITRRNIDKTNGCYLKQGMAWMLYLANGYFHFDGNDKKLAYLDINKVWFDRGDEITILFDSKSRQIAYEINGFPLGPAFRIPPPPQVGEEFYLAIDLHEQEQSVSLK